MTQRQLSKDVGVMQEQQSLGQHFVIYPTGSCAQGNLRSNLARFLFVH